MRERLRYVWLAAKRANCNRDLRRLIVAIARRIDFDYASDLLRDERAENRLIFCLDFAERFPNVRPDIPRAIVQHVDRCPPAPNVQKYYLLHSEYKLKRVKLRIQGARGSPLVTTWQRIFTSLSTRNPRDEHGFATDFN